MQTLGGRELPRQPDQEAPQAPGLRPEFTPLRRASARERRSLFILGPLLWIVGVVVVAYSVHQGTAILIALAALGGSALLALLVLLPMRAGRVRRERNR